MHRKLQSLQKPELETDVDVFRRVVVTCRSSVETKKPAPEKVQQRPYG